MESNQDIDSITKLNQFNIQKKLSFDDLKLLIEKDSNSLKESEPNCIKQIKIEESYLRHMALHLESLKSNPKILNLNLVSESVNLALVKNEELDRNPQVKTLKNKSSLKLLN